MNIKQIKKTIKINQIQITKKKNIGYTHPQPVPEFLHICAFLFKWTLIDFILGIKTYIDDPLIIRSLMVQWKKLHVVSFVSG